MSAQHTPGPWFVGAQNDALYVIDRAPRPSNDDINPDHDVCVIAKTCNQGRASGSEDANARLIAAAPELLTQLVGAVALAEHIIASLDIDPETTTLRVRANGEDIADIPISTLIANQKAAIAKAEGRS